MMDLCYYVKRVFVHMYSSVVRLNIGHVGRNVLFEPIKAIEGGKTSQLVAIRLLAIQLVFPRGAMAS